MDNNSVNETIKHEGETSTTESAHKGIDMKAKSIVIKFKSEGLDGIQEQARQIWESLVTIDKVLVKLGVSMKIDIEDRTPAAKPEASNESTESWRMDESERKQVKDALFRQFQDISFPVKRSYVQSLDTAPALLELAKILLTQFA